MSDANYTQSVPYSSADVYVTLFRKADGTLVDPLQPISIEGVVDATWDDKGTLKESHGRGKYAARLAAGKNKLSLSLTISELSGKQLNALCYGQDIESRQLKIFRDRDGHLVPDGRSSNVKIANRKTINIARFDSETSVDIDGSAATSSALETLPTGKYEHIYGPRYRFSADDVGKTCVITYDSNGTALEATFKIPARLTVNLSQLTKLTKIIKGASTELTKKTFNLTLSPPVVDDYQGSQNGVVVFNSAQTGIMKVTHVTDGITIETKIATLPAAGYGVYLDPAAAAVWTSDLYVQLLTDSGTAMTGVAEGENLTVETVLLSLASGKYMVDAKGFYLFHSADNGDVVTIRYTTDYQWIELTPPDDGVFLRGLGVRTRGGIALDRVALTSPLSLLHNQYAQADNGTVYLDETNGGDTLYIDYQYETTGGQTIVVQNTKIGEAPTLMVDMSYELDGEMMTVSFERVKPMGIGIPTKPEDFAGMKFEFEVFENKETGFVYIVSTSV